MPPYVRNQRIIDSSRTEIEHIGRFIEPREKGRTIPAAILVGGWAVDSYNPWYGSVDIDIIANHDTRHALQQYLVDERGFVRERAVEDYKRVVKWVERDRIIIDFGSRERPDRFEGTSSELDHSFLDDRCVKRYFGTASINVPERTALLLMKMKAAWDRNRRLIDGTSPDREWERTKLTKDRGDILALLDPAHGGREVRLDQLAMHFGTFPFLREVLTTIVRDRDAIVFYGRISVDDVNELIGIVLEQTT